MSNDLIIDNWTLQDVNVALTEGLSTGMCGELEVDFGSDNHEFVSRPEGAIQLDALLSLLVNIVLRDNLIVDEEFAYVWDTEDSALSDLENQKIIRKESFHDHGEAIAQMRKPIVDELCLTRSIREITDLNQKSWKESQQSVDDHMSALVLGGAGMLARSDLYEAPFFGHPHRRALIEQTRLFRHRIDATSTVEEVISTSRAKLLHYAYRNVVGHSVAIHLPSIAVEIIENSSSADELVATALSLRDEYKKLRNWLKNYQTALEQEDTKDLLKYRNQLESFASGIDSLVPGNGKIGTGISISVGWFSYDVGKGIIEHIRNRFGIRALLTRLAFAGPGTNSIKKLLKMFDADNAGISAELEREILRRNSSFPQDS